MYSPKLTIVGQVDCVVEYNGKLSVIDFKTVNKERQESWIDNYFLQTTNPYAQMYEETFGKNIDQIVILLGFRRWFCTKLCQRKERLYVAIDEIH